MSDLISGVTVWKEAFRKRFNGDVKKYRARLKELTTWDTVFGDPHEREIKITALKLLIEEGGKVK